MTTTGSSAGQRPHDLPAPPSFPPASAALFLDLDGTLAPIMPRPEHVGPDKRRAMLMKRLSATLNGRVAVVSGRALEDLDRILERGVTPVAAVHGLVRRDAEGHVVRSAPHAGIPDARQLLRDLARCDRGLQFEDKGVSVTLHYRNAPAAGEAVIEAAERIARSIAQERVRAYHRKTREIVELEKSLTETLGTRVIIETNAEGGRLLIEFFSPDDLQQLVDVLATEKEATVPQTPATPIFPNTTQLEDDVIAAAAPEEPSEDDELYSVSNFAV